MKVTGETMEEQNIEQSKEATGPDYIDFYPVGSVVVVKGNVKKMAVMARGVMTEIQGELNYFDYAGVLYPEGLISNQLVYFNHKDIVKVVYKGYEDEDEMMMRDNVNEWVKKTNIKRGNPYDLNVKNMMKKMNEK